MVYLTATAGYGGWRGSELWSDWGAWCLLLPPLAVAVVKSAGEYRRNPYPALLAISLLWALLTVVGIGGPALLLMWLVAAVTPQWSGERYVRAIIGAALGAGGGCMTILATKSRKAAEQLEPSGSEKE
jgi:hypothetical protein